MDEPSREDQMKMQDTEGQVNRVITSTIPNSISLQKIMAESLRDLDLCEVVERIRDGKWSQSPRLKKYSNVKDDLFEKNGIVFKNNKLVIPKNLRKRCLQLVHSTHLGMEKTKQFLRSKVWWPSLDGDVVEMIKTCGICQAVNPDDRERLQPLRIRTVPQLPFSTVHINLFGPLNNGETILGIID